MLDIDHRSCRFEPYNIVICCRYPPFDDLQLILWLHGRSKGAFDVGAFGHGGCSALFVQSTEDGSISGTSSSFLGTKRWLSNFLNIGFRCWVLVFPHENILGHNGGHFLSCFGRGGVGFVQPVEHRFRIARNTASRELFLILGDCV